jgi:phosphoacetylglucosamine mutase
MTCTGVKNLHHEAKHFDIGVYFEANGHGTILFSPSFRQSVSERAAGSPLAQLMALVNECVGDAISDLLLVEAVLALRKLSLSDWEAAYTELPSMQLKVPVPDRSLFITTNADQSLVRPEGLQEQVDRLVAGIPKARAFVRPSGTEDIVRVYAEAPSRTDAERLAHEIKALISH